MMPVKALLRAMFAVFLFAACGFAFAQVDPGAESKAAFAEAEKAALRGPRSVPLRDQASLSLPAGYVFVPTAQAERLLKAMGNQGGSSLAGMIFPESNGANWMAVVRYIDAGYIKDDDAKTWNADELLTSLKEGTEQQNEERRSRGIPEMEVVGWAQPPAYDGAMRRLVWSASTRGRGPGAGGDQGVNYNTYMLGREGYVSLNMVTDLKLLESNKPAAQQLLAALNFNEGKRYADFDASTDKVAEYGLAALIGGIAAKKLGLFAMLGVFLLKFWKVAAIAVAAGGVAFFRRKKPKEETPPPAA